MVGFNWAKYDIIFSEDAERKSDVIFILNSGMQLLTHASETQPPLLCACNAEGSYATPFRNHHEPVPKRHFDTVEISVNTEDGKPMPFEFYSMVKLHFGRAYNLPSLGNVRIATKPVEICIANTILMNKSGVECQFTLLPCVRKVTV